MKIGILSDTHIGKSLKTNTTINSRKLLKQSIFQTASDALSVLEVRADCVIHTADLFDSASNDEQDIRDAAAIANRCDIVMFGNHDVRNRTDSLSSIDLLDALSAGNMKPEYLKNRWSPGCDIVPLSVTGSSHKVEGYFVTHCDSQETFEKSLSIAKDSAKSSINADAADCVVLFLHANYDNDLTTGKEQNLNLTAETAEDLLEVFDFIIMGHEHQYAERFEGRVISVGTTHPTSFSDVSDKFCVVIDTESRMVEKFCTWSDHRALKVDVADFLARRFSADGVQFIDVTGTTDAKNAAAVNDAVSEVWSENEDHLIALRTSKIEYASETSDDQQEVTSLESLPEVMLSELKGSAKDLMAEALKSVER